MSPAAGVTRRAGVAILFMLNALVIVGTGVYWIYQVMNMQIHAMSDRIQFMLLIVCGTFFAALLTIGIAELIKLLIDMEHNTRVARAPPRRDQPRHRQEVDRRRGNRRRRPAPGTLRGAALRFSDECGVTSNEQRQVAALYS